MNVVLPATPVTPAAAARRLAPCLIINPQSFRASRGDLAARAAALGRAHGAELIVASDPRAIARGLDRALAPGPRPIFVLSGDGTMQALFDDLVARFGDADLPPLLLLGGGRSNVSAADVGGCGDLLAKLEAMLGRWVRGEPQEVTERRLLVVAQDGMPPRHGLFVAAGLIDEGIRACHRYRDGGQGFWRRGHASTFFFLLREAARAFLGRSSLRSPSLRVDAGTAGRLDGAMHVLLVTTLLHREGWHRPYAERGDGVLRLTAVRSTARGFWWRLPLIVNGRFAAWMNPGNGYLSTRCAHVVVEGLAACSLDGETVDTDPSRPVVIRSGPRLSLLQP